MGVIAPFRAQVALIRAALAQSAQPELRRSSADLADTVDRFQGSERNLVIYSCSSSGPELHPLLVDERRLNVALTRARHKLIVLGAILGAAILTTLPQVLTIFQEYEQLMLGLVMMLVMIFMREGLLPSVARRIRGRAE